MIHLADNFYGKLVPKIDSLITRNTEGSRAKARMRYRILVLRLTEPELGEFNLENPPNSSTP